MAKVSLKAGTTSYIANVFIQDSTSTTGSGKTGLAYNTSSLTAYYVLPGAASAAITLATQTTTGAYSSGGFVEVDSTNMPGVYRFDIPNACLAASNKSCLIELKGATGMAPCVLEFELTAVDNQDTVRYGMTALPNAASGAAGAVITSGTGTAQLSVSSGAVIVQSGTGTGQISLSSGTVTVGTNNDKTGYSLSQSFPANFADLAITATTGRVTVGTNADKTGYSLSSSQTFNVTGNISGSVGSVVGNVGGDVVGSVGSISGISFPSNFSTLSIDGSGKVLLQATQTGVTIPTVTNLTNAPSNGDFTSTMKTSIATSAWNAVATSYNSPGTMGEKLNSAASAGDPWSTALPGSYSSGTAGYIVGNNLNAPVGSVPTATQNADALLNRDMSAGTDSGSPTFRTPRQALYFLRNKWDVAGGTLTVYKTDDSTTSWTGTVSSSAGADPITGNDPA